MAYPTGPSQRQTQSQHLKHQQLIMMLPKMQHALKVLQTPVLELAALIDEELEQNPLLEVVEETQEEETPKPVEEGEVKIDHEDFSILRELSEEYKDFFEMNGEKISYTKEDEQKYLYRLNSIPSPVTIREILFRQIREEFIAEREIHIAEMIIDSLNSYGLFDSTIEEVAELAKADPKEVRDVLAVIQTFDPPGIGAKDEREALLIQISRVNGKKCLSYTIVDRYFEELLHNHIPKIAKGLGLPAKTITDTIMEQIVPLTLHPATLHDESETQAITPDAELREDSDGGLSIIINDDPIPELRLNQKYLDLLDNDSLALETKHYIKEKLLSAKHLFKSLHERGRTLARVLALVVEKQKKFFLSPKGKLVPLTMSSLAEELNLHESTIARACSGKYIYTPRGMLALRSLFTVGLEDAEGKAISSDTIRRAISDLIDREDKKKPLSDQEIVETLRFNGMLLARRTVAKYRKMLNFGNAHQRRKYE